MIDNAQMSIDQVEEHADQEWIVLATGIVKALAAGRHPFTTDKVWTMLERIPVATHEPRALGAVIRRLARDGIIIKTGAYVNTTRREAHSRPIPVWIGA
jgi:hypothetical protein